MKPRDDIAAMLRQGATYRQIRTTLRVSPATIAGIRKALDVPLPPGRTGGRAPTPDTDARVAAMLRNGATYHTIRTELGVCSARISKVRHAHGIPIPADRRSGPHAIRTPEETLAHYSKPVDGGHVTWTGPQDGRGNPQIWHRSSHLNGLRIAFRVHHGREPDGRVRRSRSCDHPGCIAGPHLTDRTIRENPDTVDHLYAAIFGT